jgi:serine/threonine protein kinase
MAATPLAYVATRFVFGTSLATVLRDGRGQPSVGRVLDITTQIAAALDAAHAAGVVHRDVSPRNILVADGDRAYLLGYPSTSDIGVDGSGPVEPAYVGHVAPERLSTDEANSDEANPGADVYSLACVLYSCLTGVQPFAGSTEQQVIGHLQDEPPTPSDANPAVPYEFNAVIARGMAKKPEDRYASAGELAEAADAALTSTAHQPAEDPPERTPETSTVDSSIGAEPAPPAIPTSECDACGRQVVEVGKTWPGDRLCGACLGGALA